ncbi:MAG TPA: hypothetical protein VFM48_15460 [Aquabacterium sp.]|nr:hypothetical protein [Aquabacterium sp.]
MLNVRERRQAAAKREAQELIGQFGEHAVATALEVDITTVRRWYRGVTAPPPVALIALRALVLGQLPGMEHKDWAGWRFGRDGFLYDDAGQRHTRGDIQGRFMERQHLRHLQRQVALLQRKIAQMDDGAANDAVEGEIKAVRS